MELPARRMSTTSRYSSWSGAAFIVEALILLMFLIAALAVLMQLFAGSARLASRSSQIERASIAASSAAERFSADPTGIETTAQDGDLTIGTDVTSEGTAAGTLYHARITVTENGDEVYTLTTARYVSKVS